jgi:hypothetical protein
VYWATGINVYWTTATDTNCKHHVALLVSQAGVNVYWTTATYTNCKHHVALLVSQPSINVYWTTTTYTNCKHHVSLLVSQSGINVYGALTLHPIAVVKIALLVCWLYRQNTWVIPRLLSSVTCALLALKLLDQELWIPSSKQRRVLAGQHVSLCSTCSDQAAQTRGIFIHPVFNTNII